MASFRPVRNEQFGLTFLSFGEDCTLSAVVRVEFELGWAAVM